MSNSLLLLKSSLAAISPHTGLYISLARTVIYDSPQVVEQARECKYLAENIASTSKIRDYEDNYIR